MTAVAKDRPLSPWGCQGGAIPRDRDGGSSHTVSLRHPFSSLSLTCWDSNRLFLV